MGKANSRLSPEQLNELQKATHFDKKELQQWYRGFLKDCPSGRLDRAELLRIYKQFFPFGDPSRFVDLIFPLFDQDKDGYVDFKDFMMALSMNSRGSLEERLDFAFQLYDVDRDGFISREELMKVVDAMYRMIGAMVKLPSDELTPEMRVNKIIQMMDQDQDGKLSMDEFREGCKLDPTLIQSLSMYEGLI